MRLPRTFQCPTCNRGTHILRKGNPNRMLSIFAGLAMVGAWPGSCPGCVRVVDVAGSIALITVTVLLALHVLR